jgi:3-oxoacyl-(acyl-carrier-protein) synthase
METFCEAKERNAGIFGEILGYAITTDFEPFGAQCLDPQQMYSAVKKSLERSGLSGDDIDLVVWAPQGNVQDNKVLTVFENYFKGKPVVTNTFNTGFIESSSAMSALGCVLYCLNTGKPLWPQITGIESIDSLKPDRGIKNILVMSSTDLGFNYSMVLNASPE